MSSQDYRVCLFVGERPTIEAATFVELNPKDGSLESLIDVMAESGVTAADLRARTIVSFSVDAFSSLQIYALLVGFAGRRLDVHVDGTTIVATDIHNTLTAIADETVRPDEGCEFLQIANGSNPEATNIDWRTPLSDGVLVDVRYARRVRIATQGLSKVAAIELLLKIAAVRARNGADRFPLVTASPDDALFTGEGDERTAVGIDLEQIRRSGNELRRTLRLDDRSTVVAAAQDDSRLAALRTAAAVPIEFALQLLGSQQNPDTGYWRCPRPSRHRNGDANPSLKVQNGTVRCFRCDAEPVDALRLVSDALNIAPDDAARILTR